MLDVLLYACYCLLACILDDASLEVWSMQMPDENSRQSKGGEARRKALSPARRTEIARQAAAARWGKDLPQATHDGVIELNNGTFAISCAVLDTTKRVLTQETFLTAIGRAGKAKAGKGVTAMVDGLPPFLAAENLTPLIDNELRESTTPVVFLTTRGQRAFGYDAALLPKVCEVYLRARDEGVLLPSQNHIATACELLMRGLAHVGIIALVDEATGFQADRARRALADILEKFISDELRRWVKTFPDDYFKELCRLKGVRFRSDMKLPQYFGKLTNNIVYKRLAPGVLRELQAVTPRTGSGARKHKFHQRLTESVGHPKLLEHLGMVIGVMKLSDDYEDFRSKLDRVAPIYKDAPLFEPAE